MLNAPINKERILAPAGTHMARCIGLIHLGTIKTEWQGEEKWIDKVRLSFELPNETLPTKEGETAKPFVVSREFTLSLGDKSNLYPIVEGIMGYIPEDVRNTFDLEDLVGKTCLITIKHEDSKNGKFASIVSTAPLMKGMVVPEPFNTYKILTYEKWDKEYFNSLPDFIKDKMKGSKQYEKMFVSKDDRVEEEIDINDIPFD